MSILASIIKPFILPKDIKNHLNDLRDNSYHTRTGAALELRIISEDPNRIAQLRYIVPELIKSLNDPGYWQIRSEAASALGNIGDPRSILPLIACLADGDSLVRQDSAKAISKLKTKYPQIVTDAARVTNDFYSGFDLAYIKGMLGDTSVQNELCHELSNVNSNRREAAVEALRFCGTQSSVATLIPVLKDKGLGWLAAKALANIGDPGAIPALEEEEAVRSLKDHFTDSIKEIKRRNNL